MYTAPQVGPRKKLPCMSHPPNTVRRLPCCRNVMTGAAAKDMLLRLDLRGLQPSIVGGGASFTHWEWGPNFLEILKGLCVQRKLTWIPKMMGWNMYLLSNMAILGSYVRFQGCIHFLDFFRVGSFCPSMSPPSHFQWLPEACFGGTWRISRRRIFAKTPRISTWVAHDCPPR